MTPSIKPIRGLFAAVSPAGADGKSWIAEWTVSRLRRDAMAKFADPTPNHPWAYWRAKGWTIRRVDLTQSLESEDGK